MSNDAERINAALTDARRLCEDLRLLDGRFGRDWMKQAKGVKVLCPWHDEKSPSCSVTCGPDGTIRVMCFGCKVTGNVFDLVATVHKLDKRGDFREVLTLAATYAGVEGPSDAPSTEPYARPVICRPPPAEEPDDGIMAAVADVLARVAPVSRAPWALDYLTARGLDCRVARGWYALPDGRDREVIRRAIVDDIGLDAWMRSGLGSEDERLGGRWSYSWHGDRVVIPWRAPNGEVDCLQARAVDPATPAADKYKFPRGRRPRWPFGVEVIAEDFGPDTSVAVVEGAIDAVSLNLLALAAGADLVTVALPGAAAWHDRWFSVFARRPVVVALDNDKTGNERGRAVAERLRAVARRGPRGPMVSMRRPSGGKDWNDVLRARVACLAETEAA